MKRILAGLLACSFGAAALASEPVRLSPRQLDGLTAAAKVVVVKPGTSVKIVPQSPAASKVAQAKMQPPANKVCGRIR